MSEKQEITQTQKQLKELQFKLEKLENFVFQHRHETLETIYDQEVESSKPFVWVQYVKGGLKKEFPPDE